MRLVAAVAAVVLVAAAPASAREKPDLRVVKATAKVDGASLTLTETVVNRTAARARTSATGWYLSTDARRSSDDVRVARRKVKALRARKRSRGTVKATAPALAAGTYRVIACADDRKKVRERSEKNNCRAAAAAFVVVAPAPVPTGTDADGDGSSPPADCDDSNAAAHPGATDLPDSAFADLNCDGIDGDAANATFVATTGSDASGCGTSTAPCLSVQNGVARAQATGHRDVYVAGGAYPGVLRVASGVNVFGGFGANWQRDPALATGSRAVALLASEGAVISGLGAQAVGLAADGVTAPTVVADLTVDAPDATTQGPGGAGRSSFGVLVRNGSGLTLARVTILAGTGAPGADASPGASASPVVRQSVMDGGQGGAGAEFSVSCDNTTRGFAGPAGLNPDVTSGSAVGGGAGGRGGTMDTDCNFSSPDFDATDGEGGVDGDQAIPSVFGTGGTPGLGRQSSCFPLGAGQDGLAGRVTNGAAGTVAPGSGAVGADGLWSASGGGSGTAGSNGGGGGGGGGAGGCDDGTDATGAGGGGGGAGGIAALGGGQGGAGGGGAFGVYLTGGSVTLGPAVSISGATGGAGGDGGAGGRGQSPGLGGPANTTHPGSAAPGKGGDGGHGGHGGGGAGGAGGDAVGILLVGASSVTGTATVTGSAGGSPGAGGISAPSAPAEYDDGNDGPAGPAGGVAATRTCGLSSSC